MLSCIYNQDEFNNEEDGYTERQIKELGRAGQLSCPKCGGLVYFCAKGKNITSHFKHYENSCDDKRLYRHDYNTERHHKAVEIFYKWIHNQYPDVKIIKDKYLTCNEMEQKADLYLETQAAKITIEIQFKHINFDELEDRRSFYMQLGIKDIWIFIKDGSFVPGTPYERYCYRGNDRELYFFNENSKLFTYYKGLKKEDFRKDRLEYYINHTCSLNEIVLNPSGMLVLPDCRQKYFEKLKSLRDVNHKQLEMRKQAAESYKVNHIPLASGKPKEMYQTLTGNYEFHNVEYYVANNYNFARVYYVSKNGELITEEFQVKSKQTGKNETHLTCRKVGDESVYLLTIIDAPGFRKLNILAYTRA